MGMTAKDMKQVVAAIIGAMTKTMRSAAFGMRSSLSASFTPSARDWSNPNLPTRLGPIRICINATMRRSPQTESRVATTQITKTITPLTRISQPGSAPMSCCVVMLSPPIQLRRQHCPGWQSLGNLPNYVESRLSQPPSELPELAT